MSRKTALSITFVCLGVAWAAWEIAASRNPHDDLVPLTNLLADYVPPAVTYAAVMLLVSWLPGHLVHAYAQRGKVMDTVTVPATPPAGDEKEPLLSRGAIVAMVAAALAVATAFGLRITEDQKAAIIGLVAVAAPIFLAVWARRKAWAPATVRAAVVTAARTGEVAAEPTVVRAEEAPPGAGERLM
jgi:hypothetical protein